MFIYIVRRLIQTIPVLLGVALVVLLMMHIIPGDAAQVLAGERASPEQIEEMRNRLGLNDPLPVQYLNYVSKAIQGNLGISIRNNRPVLDEIKTRFWITIELALVSIMVAVFFGLMAGIVSAMRKYSLSDMTLMLVALFGLSMPNFWLGIMLMYYFGVNLRWLPVSGWGSVEQMILPAITLGTAGAAIIARMTRSSMLDVINQDYIRTARAKGVKESQVIFKHALKNALIPVITVVGLEFGVLLGGAVITETVFAINGLGRLIIDSVRSRDFPVVQGTVLVVSALFVLVNLIVDVMYKVFNKRVDLN